MADEVISMNARFVSITKETRSVFDYVATN